ncbi:sec-independent translocase [Corynebacterium kutscheri]|uniref:Sec-independent protein translocase protein TatB n=1 Tax=Corynebacterium kutscheri TaxID=35755 RepID=A0AB38VZR9_9CORY|nr:Sec-independent protein translocase protein TatB [Corynebacterium kutscheri]VEH08978.1 sec-independent translocase [Corynebacterium kutscheri]VEH80110.1 sec-independent translocase [Corynebacterium kutscheri]
MFSSIGWGEIFVVFVVALIVIGPERLPRVIEDFRAAVFAARKAINNAKKELNGEFGGLSEEFSEFKEPIAQIARFQRLGPRGVITKALFDDDEEFMGSFDPKKIMSGPTQGSQHRNYAGANRVERPDSGEPSVAKQPKETETESIKDTTDNPAVELPKNKFDDVI